MRTNPLKRKADVDRESRRQNVANILLSGVSDSTTIARALDDRYGMKVSRMTVSRDIRVIEEQWRQDRADRIDAEKGKDLARMERLIAAHWRSALAGDVHASHIILKTLAQRAQLLGLNAPLRVNWRLMLNQTADNLGLSAEERKELAKRVQRRMSEIGPAGRVA